MQPFVDSSIPTLRPDVFVLVSSAAPLNVKLRNIVRNVINNCEASTKFEKWISILLSKLAVPVCAEMRNLGLGVIQP